MNMPLTESDQQANLGASTSPGAQQAVVRPLALELQVPDIEPRPSKIGPPLFTR